MKMGKKVAVLGAAVMLTFNMSIGASAQDTHKLRKTTTNYKWYTYEWERTLTCLNGDDEIGIMVYGFDMDWINEDYTWTMGYDCRTKACVKKGLMSQAHGLGMKILMIGVSRKYIIPIQR